MATKSGPSTVVLVTLLSHLIAVVVTVLLLVWLLHFRGGLALHSAIKTKIFNVHPLLMVIGIILIEGEAIMIYRTVPIKKEAQKLLHLMMHLIAIILGIIGIYAVFKYHNESNILNMFSLHSWMGLTTICLLGLQWLGSFLSFVFPGVHSRHRESYLPLHVIAGVTVFIMAVCTAEMGLVEKFFFVQLQKGKEAHIVNFTGLLIFLFGVTVVLTVVLSRRF